MKKERYRYDIVSDYETIFDYIIALEYMGKIYRYVFQNSQEWQNFEKSHTYVDRSGERFIKNVGIFFRDLKDKEITTNERTRK